MDLEQVSLDMGLHLKMQRIFSDNSLEEETHLLISWMLMDSLVTRSLNLEPSRRRRLKKPLNNNNKLEIHLETHFVWVVALEEEEALEEALVVALEVGS